MQIRGQADFEELVSKLREVDVFGVDTEFIREHNFRPRLCLIQVSFSGTCVAIDPFEVDDLGPFRELIQDPTVEKVVHAGQQDMEIFFSMNREPPHNVFDTQIAAALLGYGDSIGYSRLVEEVLGIRLDKGETFTDWARRPLSERQTEYAINDVRHLLPIRETLRAQLQERGRESWLSEELKIFESASLYQRDPSTAYQRVSGAAKLGRRELAVLRELAAWREEEAEARDRPRSRIISDGKLVEIARRSPRTSKDLSAIRGLFPKFLRQSGEAVVERAQRGLECSPEDYPASLNRRPKDESVTGIVDFLEIFLRLRAAEHRIAPGYLSSRSELAAMVQSVLSTGEPPTLRVLEGWRETVVGRDLLDLLAGRVSMRMDPQERRVIYYRP